MIMKKLVHLAALLLGFSSVVAAQQDSAAAKGNIVFDKTVHDYGKVKLNGDGNCVFSFSNEGSAALVLNNVQSSCGCTVPNWPRTPVEPGKKGDIQVRYNTNRLGAFSKTITVYSNTGQTVKLTIKGEVVN